MPSRGKPDALARALLTWYRSARRDLPWRGARDPYRIWVSEVMLQQTQAAVVGPYYRRFLERFPSAQALAAAKLSEVLALWSGLGYYGRARNLHAAAQRIATEGFPETLEGLRALPGFGPYTAAAVGSIAFGLPEPAIDGNAVRVYARLFGMRAPRTLAEPRLRALARPLLATGTPGDINQAVMDLGQLVCRVAAPSCEACPWRKPCKARHDGTTDEIPVPARAAPRRDLVEVTARITRDGALLLARRQEQGLFGGLWELPGTPVPLARGRPAAATLRALLRRALRHELDLKANVGRELASVERTLSHRNLKLIAFEVEAGGEPRATLKGRYLEAGFFSPARIARLGISSATRKLLTALW